MDASWYMYNFSMLKIHVLSLGYTTWGSWRMNDALNCQHLSKCSDIPLKELWWISCLFNPYFVTLAELVMRSAREKHRLNSVWGQPRRNMGWSLYAVCHGETWAEVCMRFATEKHGLNSVCGLPRRNMGWTWYGVSHGETCAEVCMLFATEKHGMNSVCGLPGRSMG
jgi:hypothetical protein